MRIILFCLLFLLSITLHSQGVIGNWYIENSVLNYKVDFYSNYTIKYSDKKEVKYSIDKEYFTIDSLTVYLKTNKSPYFKGGGEKLKEFIYRNLEFQPYNASKICVLVAFIIDSSGNIRDIGIRRGVNYHYDHAAYEVIKKMPQWIPAMKDDKNVSSIFFLLVDFTP